jgi:hypothetical protein
LRLSAPTWHTTRNDNESRMPQLGEPDSEWLLPVHQRAADLAGDEPEALAQVLVQCYP